MSYESTCHTKVSSFVLDSRSQYSTLACSRDLRDVERPPTASSVRTKADEDTFVADYFRHYGQRGIRRAHTGSGGSDWQWSMAQDAYDYNERQSLGEGTYGKVYRAVPCHRGRAIALKVCHVDQPPDHGLPETIIREVTLLRILHEHPNVMSLEAVSCARAREVFLFCELLEMDLMRYIRSRLVIPMEPGFSQAALAREEDVKWIARCLLSGLAYCHAYGIIHRDLKPHNILVTRDLKKIKIADFGLARIAHNPNKTLTHEVVTLWYRAPELLLGECHYDEAVDVWSAGCIIAEMLRGHVLFRGDSEIDMLFRIFRLFGTPSQSDWPRTAFEERRIFPTFQGDRRDLGISGPAADLICRMLSVNPARRPSCQQCLAHEWLLEQD